MAPDTIVHIIDDDEAVRDALGALLMAEGLDVAFYPSPVNFLADPPQSNAGCIVTDVQMPEMTGLELLRRLHAAAIRLPVIVMTGRVQAAMAADAVKNGAWAFIEKPFTPETIVATVRDAMAGRPVGWQA
jgi:two-component system response regulator FixJ